MLDFRLKKNEISYALTSKKWELCEPRELAPIDSPLVGALSEDEFYIYGGASFSNYMHADGVVFNTETKTIQWEMEEQNLAV